MASAAGKGGEGGEGNLNEEKFFHTNWASWLKQLHLTGLFVIEPALLLPLTAAAATVAWLPSRIWEKLPGIFFHETHIFHLELQSHSLSQTALSFFSRTQTLFLQSLFLSLSQSVSFCLSMYIFLLFYHSSVIMSFVFHSVFLSSFYFYHSSIILACYQSSFVLAFFVHPIIILFSTFFIRSF